MNYYSSPTSMGYQAIQFISQFPVPISHNYYRRFIADNYTTNRTRQWRCLSDGRSGGSRWDWDKNVNPNRRSRFSDAYVTDEYDNEDEFGFRDPAKQRVWWSDEFYEEEDEGFGVLEASIALNWAFKVFQAFGWMIPAVIISLLLGTGPNSIIMALALPLAQSAFTLVVDTLWGRDDETLRPKSKSKKRRSAGSPGRARVRKEKETRTQTRKEAGSYKSWFEANNVSAAKRSPQDFGGWDELDNQVRVDKSPRVASVKQENVPRAEGRVKISRKTKGDTPLFMRLLIAMFPYLGFWTKLF